MSSTTESDFHVSEADLEQVKALAKEFGSSDKEIDEIVKEFNEGMSSTLYLSKEERHFLDCPPKPLETADLAGVAKYIAEGHAKNIIVMTGAGISCSAGIPDFRTPGTGLYYNLQKYNLPRPENLFDIKYFPTNPKPFYEFAKCLYPGQYHPTLAHYFVRLLDQHGLLLRNFTQNIDTLEQIAGIRGEKTVFCHGSFTKAHCIKCHKEYPPEFVRDKIFANEIVKCDSCGSYVKPDIVFFGEALPDEFFEKMEVDFPKCDLLIVMGTSLQVHPFCDLIDKVADNVPRLLINMEVVGAKGAPPPADAKERERFTYRASNKFAFNDPENRRDALFKGACDDGVQALAEALGWDKELQEMFDAPFTPAAI